jgi:hypothetical protein
VTVGTGLGLDLALRVRIVRVHHLRAVAARSNRRLLNVNTFAVDVGR